jgi:hypothetical protein
LGHEVVLVMLDFPVMMKMANVWRALWKRNRRRGRAGSQNLLKNDVAYHAKASQ